MPTTQQQQRNIGKERAQAKRAAQGGEHQTEKWAKVLEQAFLQ